MEPYKPTLSLALDTFFHHSIIPEMSRSQPQIKAGCATTYQQFTVIRVHNRQAAGFVCVEINALPMDPKQPGLSIVF
jgi:hypothetical protein